jgi:hypothetical protein
MGWSYCSQTLFPKHQQELEPAIATTPGIPDIRIHLRPDGALVFSRSVIKFTSDQALKQETGAMVNEPTSIVEQTTLMKLFQQQQAFIIFVFSESGRQNKLLVISKRLPQNQQYFGRHSH